MSDTHRRLSLTGFPFSASGFVDGMLSQAVQLGASDVHLERCRHYARLRYRLDGVLVKVDSGTFLFDEYSSVVTRLRILASLDIAERRAPQDGRFSYVGERGTVDIRISVLQAVSGERIVLRLLSAVTDDTDLNALGMTTHEATLVEHAVCASQGMVLVTGPTGSGKTTTLYTILSRINTEQVNILAVEDPVERRLDGIGQVQVREQAGLGFADTLRAFLRQDPEVILVGEIRDLETAGIAFKAALTGHLVLSTLHTNNCAATIARLVNIGLPAQLISSSLSLILAQRLVRVLCPQCRVEYEASVELLNSMGFTHAELSEANLFRHVGCERCSWTGYRSRRGIFELLKIDEPVRTAIQSEAPISEVAQLLTAQGGVSLACGRRRLLLEGVIDLAEYQRTA